MKPQDTLVVGIGNRYRRDDASGLEVISRLRHYNNLPAELVEWDGDLWGLLHRWRGYQRVIVVDAVAADFAPGTVLRYSWSLACPLPTTLHWRSSHSASLVDILTLAHTLGCAPPSVVLYGVVGKSFEMGLGLSAEVAKGVERAVSYILQEIAPEHARVCDC